MSAKRIVINYINYGGGGGFFVKFGMSQLCQKAESEIENSFTAWEKFRRFGINSLCLRVDFKKGLSSKMAIDPKWRKSWRIDNDGTLECDGLSIDTSSLVKSYGKDYESGALWLYEKMVDLGKAVVTQVERNLAKYSKRRDGEIEYLEVERRQRLARDAILSAFGKNTGDDNVNFFVEYHLKHLPTSYWHSKLGSSVPEPRAVIDLLQFTRSWGRDDIEYFDFTLPNGITDYLIAVHFNDKGAVDEILMES